MNADLSNTTDRRLLLGILHRDNDLEPRKKAMGGSNHGHNQQPSEAEMSNVNLNSHLDGGDGGDGTNLQDLLSSGRDAKPP